MKSKTILIADNDKDLCESLALRCSRLGIDSAIATDGVDALRLADSIMPEIICLDMDMLGSGGLTVCEMFHGLERFKSTPFIYMTGRDTVETIARSKQFGARYASKFGSTWFKLHIVILEMLNQNAIFNDSAKFASDEFSVADKPPLGHAGAILADDRDQILTAIFSALGVDDSYLQLNEIKREATLSDRQSFRVDQAKSWILHVDDDAELSNALKLRLENHGIAVTQAYSGISGISQASTTQASAIILDYEMPRGDGRYVIKRLKECAATRHIPIIILTGYRSQDLKQELLALGADCFLSKPVQLETLLSTLRQYVELVEPQDVS